MLARPGPKSNLVGFPATKTLGPRAPKGLTDQQRQCWQELAQNPNLIKADYGLLFDYMDIMEIRTTALETVKKALIVKSRLQGDEVTPAYKVFRETSEMLMVLRRRMLATPEARRLAAGKKNPMLNAKTANTEDDDIEIDE